MFLQCLAGWRHVKVTDQRTNHDFAWCMQNSAVPDKKLEFHYTLEYSRWLDVAEIEISVLTEQRLDLRMGSQEIVTNEIGGWESERNAARATID